MFQNISSDKYQFHAAFYPNFLSANKSVLNVKIYFILMLSRLFYTILIQFET